MATWEQVQQNPTLYPLALLPDEGRQLRWHDDAHMPHSSQVFCVSSFGMLRHLSVRDQVIRQLLGLSTGNAPAWSIKLEYENRNILSEFGPGQASSIDACLESETTALCVESKFLSDAKAGFGGCSQPKKDKKTGIIKCAGFYGPDSDLKTHTSAWCRLEVWDGERSPRTYWALGRAFFRDAVFAKQSSEAKCPFNGPNYQLMRNFLFAAALAQQQKLQSFGVILVAPERTRGKLEKQIDSFRQTIIQPQFGSCVQFVTYERLIELLRQTGDVGAVALATFLAGRISDLIP